MNLQLDDKVVLVAGSTQGIGYAIAESFLNEGARVVVTGRNHDSLKKASIHLKSKYSPDRLLFIRGDLSKKAFIAKVLKSIRSTWKRIDCLVANIGSGTAKPGWDLEEADWSSTFNINFWSSIRLIQAVLREMVQEKGGAIVLVSSVAGVEATGAPLTYSAAKAALISYGKNLSRQVAGHGIRVNCVAPGNVLFPGGSWDKKLQANPNEVNRLIDREVPMKRFGRPEEIADIVTFLASGRAGFMTGSCIVADGGQTRSV